LIVVSVKLGAGGVVTREVPDDAVVAGVAARAISPPRNV
jgi:serine acetyltransferase